jgi:hypothetical protein
MSNIEIDRDEGAIRKERAAQSQENRNLTVFAGRFKGSTAVITGGVSGLGLACAKCSVEEGGRVALWDLNPQASLKIKRCWTVPIRWKSMYPISSMSQPQQSKAGMR